MADQTQRADRDLVIPPGSYALVLATTEGTVSTYVGPRSSTLSPTDRLVTWTGRRFAQTNDMTQAIQPCIRAAEGQYVVLTDPAREDAEKFAQQAQVNPAVPLASGERIVIPGPVTFAPWPGQTAQVIDGHHLNLNQYLVAQVYEPRAARENMARAIAAPSTGEGEAESITEREFTMGERIVIKGTEVSFYVPPTGIEVVPESGKRPDAFVREAASLEQLEYCFTRGHQVRLAKGSNYRKFIEDLREGDEVLGVDEATGDLAPTRVVETSSRVVGELIRLYFASGRSVQCSPEHPFHVAKRHGWVPAGDLRDGDEVSELAVGHSDHAPGGHCDACGDWTPALEMDHVRARKEAGRHEVANLCWLCPACHKAKSRGESSRIHRRRLSTPDERERMSRVMRERWTAMTAEEKAAHIARWRDGARRWADAHPEERAAIIVKANGARLAKLAARPPVIKVLLTPEERAQRRADGIRRRLAEMTPEEHAAYRARVGEGRRRAWASVPAEGRREHLRPANEARGVTNGDKIIGIERVTEPAEVYNVQCAPHANFFVRGLLVHNCVLVDENGSKRYERGPAVVFPEPTETFVTEGRADKETRKFRAIELNDQSGLYVKVIAEYTDEAGVKHNEGEELFITGKETPIYFPRTEEAVIHYGEQRKHHAVAVPEGEGRYVLDRRNGRVELVVGPSMFLPDPRTQVVVRRVLEDREVAIMYPGNAEAAMVNADLRGQQERSGEKFLQAAYVSQASQTESGSLATSYGATATFAGDRMRRGTSYTPPRTITLDTKYQGAVSVSVWPGYAVLVMDKTGSRRVETGPVNLLLEYDETLMALSLSTGRPKTDMNRLRTVYLRTVNNSVGDIVTVETRDLVPVTLELSLRVNFEGDEPTKWFEVEDYVALLTEHCRSRLRNMAKRHEIQDFYTNTIDIVRDALLGTAKDDKPRPGLPFAENGMRLFDVEVLAVSIDDAAVGTLLSGAMQRALTGAIQLSEAEREATRMKRLEEIERDKLAATQLTQDARSQNRIANLANLATETLEELDGDARTTTAKGAVSELARAIEKAESENTLGIQRELDSVQLQRLSTETELLINRMKSIDPSLIAAIQEFGDKSFVERVVAAMGPSAMASGVATVDLLNQVFKGTPFEKITETLSQRPLAPAANGHGAAAGELEPSKS